MRQAGGHARSDGDLALLTVTLETLNRGQISEAEAIRRVRALPPLSKEAAERAADRATQPPNVPPPAAAFILEDLAIGPMLFSTLENRRNHALLLFENLRSRDGDSLEPDRTVKDFLHATIDILTEKHDPVLMAHAITLAEEFASATESADAFILAGRVHFEPFSAGPGYDDYFHCLQLRRLRQAWRQGLPFPVAELDRFPSYNDSFDRAASFFQRAVDQGNGHDRGRALAYLALLALTGRMMDRPIDTSVVTEMVAEADRLLPRAEDPTIWARLFLFAGDLDDPTVMFRNPPINIKNFGRMVSAFGLYSTVSLYLSGIQAAVDTGEKSVAIELSRLLFPYIPRVGMEQVRIEMRRCLAHCLPGDSTSCNEHINGPGPAPYLVQGSLAAAIHSVQHVTVDDRMHDYIADRLRQSRLRGELRDALAIAETRRLARPEVLVRDARAENIADTTRAALDYMALDLAETATLCIFALGRQLEQLNDVGSAEAELGTLLSNGVLTTSWVCANFEDVGKRHWQKSLLELARIALLSQSSLTDPILFLVHQWAKGFVLAAAIRGDRREIDSLTHHISQLLRAWVLVDLGPLAPDYSPDPSDASPHDPRWAQAKLASALWTLEMTEGADASQFAANGRRLYHNRIVRAMNHAALAAPEHSRPLIELQESLPVGTCLLTLLTGHLGSNIGSAIIAQLISPWSVRSLAIRNEDPVTPISVLVGEAGGSGLLDISIQFLSVPKLIGKIQEEPFRRVASRQAEAELRALAEKVGPVLDVLENDPELDDVGIIYIWPHGASHLLPFWLLPYRDGLLADYFTVCMLPCLEPVFWSSRQSVEDGIFAIASADGGVPHGLASEPSTESSASAIAAVFGSEPLLGDEATPGAFLERAGRTPYIHLAAHGMQDLDAPMYHCLYLSGQEGQLFADQILKCDLRAVRLVTVEACESLLVRYDCEDNLTGLPSLFLRAGAGAVAGALWAVRPEVSARFFVSLYEQLKSGTSVAYAFGSAQQHTRQVFPRYMDWGAFCLVGFGG